MVSFTETAKKKILEALSQPGISESYALRLGLSGGACAGKYIIGFDQKAADDDKYFIDGIPVIIAKKHLMYLMDKKVDYKTENNESYFGIE